MTTITNKSKQIVYIFFAILFLAGCHHNAHIRTQRPLSPSETVFSGSLTPFPIGLGNKVDFLGNKPEKSIGILGMRSELSFLSGLKNNQEIGTYAGLGLGSFVSGNIYGLHYKKYKYSPFTDKLVKVGGGLEINVSDRGKVFNTKTSIIEASSEEYKRYKGIHFLYAHSLGYIRKYYDRNFKNYSNLSYKIQSVGIGLTMGRERKTYIKNTYLQSQIDISLIQDNFSYNNKSVYVLFAFSLGFNIFNPSTNPKTSFEPLPIFRERSTKLSTDQFLNTTNENLDFETEKLIKDSDIIFDPETGDEIEKENVEYDPETGEEIE